MHILQEYFSDYPGSFTSCLFAKSKNDIPDYNALYRDCYCGIVILAIYGEFKKIKETNERRV